MKPNEIEKAVLAFQAATGLRACIKVFDPQGAESSGDSKLGKGSERFRLHKSPFCREVKRTRSSQCIECDLRKVPELCLRKRSPFVHTCHAGASEIIVPVFVEERLRAIAYLGPFRVRKSQPDELPAVSPEQSRHHLALSRLLRAWLTEQAGIPAFNRETSRGYRHDAIRAYLLKNLSRNPSLSDLARHLGLSRARTAHVVKEATGRSFTALRDSIRTSRACTLLRNTYYKIAAVAAECGISSPQYFHRFFLRKTGTTPDNFRRRQRMDA